MGTRVFNKMCVPLRKRKRNQVDKLQEKIIELQKSCQHDYKPIKALELHESYIAGYYIIGTYESSTIHLQCLKCNQKKEADIINTHTCPNCLGSIIKCKAPPYYNQSKKISSGEEFLGLNYRYYSVKLAKCPNCDIKFVWGEFEW